MGRRLPNPKFPREHPCHPRNRMDAQDAASVHDRLSSDAPWRMSVLCHLIWLPGLGEPLEIDLKG